jgi:cation diffusion facilitator family transporter
MSLHKQKLGYLEGWTSVLLNSAIFAFKFWIGKSLNSISMLADAWHTLSDSLTSMIVIIGFFMMAKPADKKHPFGHARAENIAAIVIGVLLAGAGINFFRESIFRLIRHQMVTFSLFAIIVFLISAMAKELLARFSFWAGKKINSQSLAADGWHHRSDAIASALIVIGALVSKSLWWIDGLLGMGVSILIIYAAFDIFKNTVSDLLGEGVDSELRERIINSIRNECPEVKGIHHLHIHHYGNNMELTIHIKLFPQMNVKDAHLISSRIEKRLRDEFKLEPTVHVEPLVNLPPQSNTTNPRIV